MSAALLFVRYRRHRATAWKNSHVVRPFFSLNELLRQEHEAVDSEAAEADVVPQHAGPLRPLREMFLEELELASAAADKKRKELRAGAAAIELESDSADYEPLPQADSAPKVRV